MSSLIKGVDFVKSAAPFVYIKNNIMKHFYDCEFLEGTQDKRFLGIKYGKTPPTIDLISIGFVAEDGREYYAISNEFNLYEAWNRYQTTKVEDREDYCGQVVAFIEDKKIYWIRENVLRPIWKQEILKMHAFTNLKESMNWEYAEFNYKNFCELIRLKGKSRKRIALEIVNFVHGYCDLGNWFGSTEAYYEELSKQEPKDKPEFYGYYSTYDHVVLCQLFGKMIDLPKGFPMLTYDLKQMLDEKAPDGKYTGAFEEFFEDQVEILIKNHPNYPKQTNEHNALSDARWNKKLYDFIQKL